MKTMIMITGVRKARHNTNWVMARINEVTHWTVRHWTVKHDPESGQTRPTGPTPDHKTGNAFSDPGSALIEVEKLMKPGSKARIHIRGEKTISSPSFLYLFFAFEDLLKDLSAHKRLTYMSKIAQILGENPEKR